MLEFQKLTDQQQKIIEIIKSDQNCVVNAKLGTGKTSVALNLIEQISGDVLVIMYNHSLSSSTCCKLAGLKSNISRKVHVHTYHSLLSALTQTVVCDDLKFIEVLNKIKESPMEPWIGRNFELLIIDEAQDLRPLYFELIKLLVTYISPNPHKIRYLVLGEPKQLLYNYFTTNNADARFMTKMPFLLDALTDKPWSMLSMTKSFRLTPQIAATLNTLFPSEDLIVGCNVNGPPVCLHICNTYKDSVRILQRYIPMLKQHSKDVFLLCPSANNTSPLTKVVNSLVNHNIRVHVTRSGNLSECCPRTNVSFTKNKAQAMPYPTSKGLESVIVCAINTRELFNGSNALYVALGRAGYQLIIIQDVKFVTSELLESFASLSAPENLKIIVHRNLPTKLPLPYNVLPKITSNVKVASCHSNNNNHNNNNDTNNNNVSGNSQPTKGKYENEPLPKAFTLHELFTFVDAQVLSELLSYVTVTTIQTKLDIAFPDAILEEEKNDDYILHYDRLEQEQLGSYGIDLIVTMSISDERKESTTKPDQVHMNVMSNVGDALIMGIEFLLKPNKLPSIAHKLQLQVDPSHTLYTQTQNSIHMLQVAQQNVTNTPTCSSDLCSKIETLLPHFACLVSIHDSFYHFADRHALLANFDYIMKPSIFLRFNRFVQNIEMILRKFSSQTKLSFNEEHTAHIKFYIDENTPKQISLKGKSTITVGNKAIIYCVHSPTTSTNDFLAVAAMAEVVQVQETYLINIYDGSAVQLKIENNLEFLSVAVSAKMKCETELSDEEFIKLYKAEKITWDTSNDFIDHSTQDEMDQLKINSPATPPSDYNDAVYFSEDDM